MAAIYSFTYQVISSKLYVSLVTADNNKFLHCIPKEPWKEFLTPLHSEHSTARSWRNFDQNFHSSIVSTKLNQVHFEWAQEKPDNFINVIKLEAACNNLI